MPPVKAVELESNQQSTSETESQDLPKSHLDAASVAPPALEERAVQVADLLERIERPAAPMPHQAQDRGEVVGHDDAREPAAVDEARGLEDVLLLGQTLFSVAEFGQILFVRPALVELQQLLCDMLIGGSACCNSDVFGQHDRDLHCDSC